MGVTCVRAKFLHLCPTLFYPMDCSLPGSSVRGILQAKLPEWVAMPSFMGSSYPGINPHLTGSLPLAPPAGSPKGGATAILSMSLTEM